MRSVTLLFGFTSVISQLPQSFAAAQQLPHEVYNVTAVEPPSLPLVTVNFTITDTVTDTITDTTTATTTATTTETTTLPPPPPPVSTLTVIYPSPDAAPVEVTSISQVVTSFIPEATFCVGPALVFSSIEGGPFTNGSANVTQWLSGTSSCSTQYSTTTTTVCATTLTGLASKITVSECSQEITFSSECGFSLEVPTPTPISTPTPTPTPSPASASASSTTFPLTTPPPTLHTLMTYYLAPWQSFTPGTPPSSVDVKICTLHPSSPPTCQRYQEVWEIIPVTTTLTRSFPVTFSQTLEGPGALIFDSSTSFVDSTREVVSLSKTLRLETEVTGEGTGRSEAPWTTVRVTSQKTSVVTVTRQLERVSESSGLSATTTTTTTAEEPLETSSSESVSSSESSESNSSSEPQLESTTTSREPTTTVFVTSFVTERRTSTVTRSRSKSTLGTSSSGSTSAEASDS